MFAAKLLVSDSCSGCNPSVTDIRGQRWPIVLRCHLGCSRIVGAGAKESPCFAIGSVPSRSPKWCSMVLRMCSNAECPARGSKDSRPRKTPIGNHCRKPTRRFHFHDFAGRRYFPIGRYGLGVCRRKRTDTVRSGGHSNKRLDAEQAVIRSLVHMASMANAAREDFVCDSEPGANCFSSVLANHASKRASPGVRGRGH